MTQARHVAASRPPALASQDVIAQGRQVLEAEITALQAVAARIDSSFAQAVELILNCSGMVVVTGMGKAGLIGQKLAASLSSTGTPSYFLHPAEAVHGDLGCLRANDVVIFLSYSGETEEVVRILPTASTATCATLAITADEDSTLGRSVDLVLALGIHREACALGLAPSCSTTSMLAFGDALALVVSRQRGFSREQFARLHPAGSLGRQLSKVQDVMRPLSDCRLALESSSVREVLIHVGRPGRRTGAVMLVDTTGRLVGIFTDSDLARLLEQSHDSQLEQPIREVMTRRFQTIGQSSLLSDAMRILADCKISELPVISEEQRPLGIIDVTDVVSVISDSWAAEKPPSDGVPTILSLAKYRPQAS